MASANWQRVGKKSAPRPKPLSPLGKGGKGGQRRRAPTGRQQRPIEEIVAYLDQFNPHLQAAAEANGQVQDTPVGEAH